MAFSVMIGSAAKSAPHCVRPALVAAVINAPHAGLVSTSMRAPTRVSPAVVTASTLTTVRSTAGQTGSTNEYIHDSTPCSQEFEHLVFFHRYLVPAWGCLYASSDFNSVLFLCISFLLVQQMTVTKVIATCPPRVNDLSFHYYFAAYS